MDSRRAASRVVVCLVLVLAMGLALVPSLSPARAEQLGQWQTSSNPYPVSVFVQSCVPYSGDVFCVGGLIAGGATSHAYYAQLTATGTSSWTQTTSYPAAIEQESCTVVGTDVYCVGGAESSGGAFVSLVYYASLSTTTGIGSWTQATSIPEALSGYQCVSYSGYIYCVSSGTNGSDVGYTTTYYGSVSGSTIGWTQGSNTPTGLSGTSCVTWMNYVYCQGDASAQPPTPPSGAYSAELSSGGFGAWSNQTSSYVGIPTAGFSSCWTSSGYVYCAGGGSDNENVYYAAIGSGTIGTWEETDGFASTQLDSPCVVNSGYVYCIAGYTGDSTTDQVIYDSIQAPGSSTTVTVTSTVTSGVTLGAWTSTTPYPLNTQSFASCVTYSGYMYCVGGFNSTGPTNAAYYGELAAGGISSWVSTKSYPIPIIGAACALSGSDVWCFGGENSNYKSITQVYWAQLSSSGIGTWTNATSTAALPVKSSEIACVISSGYAYCVGVGGNYADGTSATYYGEISGSTISWHAGTSYPVSVDFFNQNQCAADAGYIYCFGNGTGTPSDAVYSAAISSSGFGTWSNQTETTDQPELQSLAGASCALTTSPSYAICVGTDGTGELVYYASVSSGDLGAWTITTPYPQLIAGGSCGISGSYIYCRGSTGDDSSPNDPAYYASLTISSGGTTVTVTSTSVTTSTVTSTTTSTTTKTVTDSTTITSTSTTTRVGSTTVTSTLTTTKTATVTSTTTEPTTLTTTTTATVTGTGPYTVLVATREAGGTAVSGVTVTLDYADGTQVGQMATNSSGDALFTGVASGQSYKVSGTVEGQALSATFAIAGADAVVVLESGASSATSSTSSSSTTSSTATTSQTSSSTSSTTSSSSTTTSSSSATSGGELEVSVSPGAPRYAEGSTATLSVVVKTASGTVVDGATVALHVRYPEGAMVTDTVTTNSEGMASWSFTVPYGAGVGTASVIADASMGSETGTGSTTFVVAAPGAAQGTPVVASDLVQSALALSLAVGGASAVGFAIHLRSRRLQASARRAHGSLAQ